MALVAADPELEYFEADFQETMNPKTQEVISIKTPGYLYRKWHGVTRFWWVTGQIVCKSPQPAEIMKCVHMAQTLNALVVGDEGEVYETRRRFFGNEKLGYTDAEGKFHDC
jgi:hypothetical protein